MQKKSIKFRDHLAKLVLAGEKDLTWRLFDDKNLSVGDEVEFFNYQTGEKFADAVLIKVWKKKMKDLDNEDFDGHEKFTNQEQLYQTYKTYYGDRVGPETVVKIIRFRLL